MDDTWAERDLPVLDAVVSLLDEGAAAGVMPEVTDIAARSGLGEAEVAAALQALKGKFLDLELTMGSISAWWVTGVTPDARRVVGQWPTGESLIVRLAGGIAEAAEREADPERKKTLRVVAREPGGMAKAVAVDVTSNALSCHDRQCLPAY
jgi:hypothetical protein